MSIQAVSMTTNCASCGPKKQVNFGDKPKVKNEGGAGKAIASAFITGLGQMCDGRTKTGVKMLGAELGLDVVSGALTMVAMAAKSKIGSYVALGGAVVAGLSALGTKIYSIVDAYKGGK